MSYDLTVAESDKATSISTKADNFQTIFKLEQSSELTTAGDRYWRFTNRVVPIEKALPIWASELDWFLTVLMGISQSLDLESLPAAQQPYPLAVRPAGTGALLVMLQRNVQGSELWVERWSSRRPNSSTPTGIQYFTYWYRDFRLQNWSRTKINLRNDWRDALRHFVAVQVAHFSNRLALEWTQLVKSNDVLPKEMPSLDHITVARTNHGLVRRIPWYPFCPNLSAARVLKHPLRRALLDACQAPISSAHLALKLENTIDEQTAREQLAWTVRYEDATLKNAFFFSIVRQDREDHFVATRAQPGFLADGLLSSLADVTTETDAKDPPAPSPQATDGIPIERLSQAKLIHRYAKSAFGYFPRPSHERARANRAAAAPSARLKQERWKILQWLDLESSAQANFTEPDPLKRILGWQRLALLRHDCATFFGNEREKDEAIGGLLDLAAHRHAAIIRGDRVPSTLRRSTQMPRPQ
jgi:hypothetical protein